jgi:hypothetical protein
MQTVAWGSVSPPVPTMAPQGPGDHWQPGPDGEPEIKLEWKWELQPRPWRLVAEPAILSHPKSASQAWGGR